MKPAGGWLRWAWRAWLVYVLVLAALVLLSLPTLYEALRRPCDAATQYCPGMALTPDQFANLQASSLPIELHAALSLAITFAVDSGVGFTLALVLFWRRRDNWAALLLALPIVSHAAAYPGGLLLLEAAHPWLRPLTRLPDFFVLLGWYAAFLVFPDGRFVPRWGRWLLLAAVPAALVTYAIDATEFESPVAAAISTGFALSFVLILAFQIYRYWRVSSPTQQAQARWVIYCFAILLGFLAVIQPGLKLIFPVLADPTSVFAHDFNHVTGTLFGPTMVFLGLWLAIVRARLWDIDLIIRRTLVYSALTALLALVYFGSVVVLEGALRGLTGGGSQAAIVLSTLLIAALFGPLRGRVQRAIDQRFFRRKYDAARTLAAFGASARDEVDLEALGEQLTGVVDEAMQPAQVGLWVKATSDQTGRRRR